MKEIDISFLRECLEYDADTGDLRWKERPREHFKSDRGWRTFNSRFSGITAGTTSKTTGYIVINMGVSGGLIQAHRIIWALEHSEWPRGHIDHIDGVRANNKSCNIRQCERSENQCNRGAQSNSASGLKGAHKHVSGKWRARINKSGKTHELGLFISPQDAHSAYIKASSRIHGEFARV